MPRSASDPNEPYMNRLSSLANVFCFLLTSKAGWRKLVDEVGFTIRDEGTFNGMWFAVLERPRADP